ncbi:MAG TPA: hypothetical protein VHT24_01180 [Pseudacidobacterium sp.]|jgi:hypothetical protein|nr:hypothetical protein [Pseudacidobacterium sp.]
MYRQVGGSALLLLLISSAISNIAGPGKSNRSAIENRSTANHSAESTSEIPAVEADWRKCYIFEALRRYMGVTESATQSEEAGAGTAPSTGNLHCTPSTFTAIFPSGLSEIDRAHSQILMATVPDPLESSEALQFDRDIAALQEAASTAGYDFVWLTTPWRVSDLSDPKDLKESREMERYREHFGDEPGALLFRRRTRADNVRLESPDSLLLIVLVPESPVYGLNLAAAREGLSAVSTLLDHGFRATPLDTAEGRTRIRWIGPNYSASAPGLRILEREVYPRISFDALSGTISTSAANAFLVDINQQASGTTTAKGAKATLSELDLDSLCWFLGQESRIRKHFDEPIAVLQEDETAYGSSTADAADPNNPCNPLRDLVRRFTFPRGVSHVRSVFGSTLKNATPSRTQEENNTSRSGDVTLTFRDELEEPLDAVPEFAPQSPVSNESVLAAIATSIKHLHARAIVIRTSDPLDQLFLARYFRQQCPDSRVVLLNSDRLLTRLRGDFNLDGTLIVTRFPLFQNSYLQTPFRGESRHSLSFTNSREEAIFLAALMQIQGKRLQLLQSPFAHRHFAMAPWIGVASGGDFWPVAYLGKDQITPDPNNRDNVLLLTDTPPEPLPTLWTLVLLMLLFISLLHFLFFVIAVPLNSRLRKSEKEWVRRIAVHQILAYYLFPPSPTCEQSRLFAGQCWWLMNVSTQLTLMVAYLLFPAITYQAKVQNVTSVTAAVRNFPMQTTVLSGFTLIVLVLQILMAGMLLILLVKQCRQSGKSFFVRFEHCLLPVISGVWLLISLALFCAQLVDPQTGFAFAARCLHLSSGVCPILPLLLLSAGFLIAAVVNLNALSMAITRNPGVPDLQWSFLDMNAWQKKLKGFTELWYGLPGADGKVLAAFVVLAFLLLHPQKLFATFDTPSAGWLFTLNFVFAIWTVLWLWIRFIRIWSVLRGGLDCLEGSPLRFAFSRLPAIFSVDPIWSYSGLRRVVVLPLRWFEYLKVAPAAPPAKQLVLDDNSWQLGKILQQMRDSEWMDSLTYARFSGEQNAYAVTLSQQPAIHASWERGGPDCNMAAAPAKKEETDEEEGPSTCSQLRSDVPSPCGTTFDASNCAVEIGNEYIAMRIGAYIRYITLHMKNLMTFMSLGFLLTLLAAVSYPFDRPQIIAWAETIVLAALLFTVGTILAQMDRDAVLSRMGNTTPGRVRYMTLLRHMIAVGGLPLITVLATLFPSIGSALFSWAGPLFESLR